MTVINGVSFLTQSPENIIVSKDLNELRQRGYAPIL
jgi:hypothetical protein